MPQRTASTCLRRSIRAIRDRGRRWKPRSASLRSRRGKTAGCWEKLAPVYQLDCGRNGIRVRSTGHMLYTERPGFLLVQHICDIWAAHGSVSVLSLMTIELFNEQLHRTRWRRSDGVTEDA